jgi:hypothetical protein
MPPICSRLGTAAGHVGGDGDFATEAGAADDFGFFCDLVGVEHFVFDTDLGKHSGNDFALVDRTGPDQDRPPGRVNLGDFADDRLVFFFGGTVDAIGEALASRGPVRRDADDGGAIDPFQFARAAGRGAGHPGEVGIAEEEVLDRDPRGLSGRDADFDLLFCLDRLVDPVTPLASFGQAAGEFVDDDDFHPTLLPGADDVLPIEDEFAVDFDRAFGEFVKIDQAHRADEVLFGERADLLAAAGGQFETLRLVVDFEMFVEDKFRRVLRGPAVGLDDLVADGVFDRTDDQRRGNSASPA